MRLIEFWCLNRFERVIIETVVGLSLIALAEIAAWTLRTL